MINFEGLLSLAKLAGLEATINRPITVTKTKGLTAPGGEVVEKFSVCVAAPSHDPSDRYRAFNAKGDDAQAAVERNVSYLREGARALGPDGLMFVYALPRHLARYAAALSDDLVFRYWVAIRTMTSPKPG